MLPLTVLEDEPPQEPLPRWLAPSLDVNEGLDPLGLQTTTQDRLMPAMLPGILELSRRARYFSFHAFLLAEYRDQRRPTDSATLSTFIKQREWDYGLAVLRCPRGCQSSPVGMRRLGSVAAGSGPFPRGESVQSALGGYGLYYRSPMAELGVVARAGTLLGDSPIPIDVLYDTTRARTLAATFHEAVQETAYVRRFMATAEPLPLEVVEEYATAACLCGLHERPDEQEAIYNALFGVDPPDLHSPVGDDGTNAAAGLPATSSAATDVFLDDAVVQRRVSVAHFLTLIETNPDVSRSEGGFRDAVWAAPGSRGARHAAVAGQWAAVIAKDVWQEAICSVWSEFCRTGLARTRALERGLAWEEVRLLAGGLVNGPPVLDGLSPTSDIVGAIAARNIDALSDDDAPRPVVDCTLEQLRQFTVRSDTASSGLVVVLELARRMRQRTGAGWQQGVQMASGWQVSVGDVASGLAAHLANAPTVADTMWWLVERFVLTVHERIAYSKMPEFTFRFRWENGLLRFYDLGVGRFTLAAIRHQPLASLTHDLGFWGVAGTEGETAIITTRGSAFIDLALP